ncbi:MAG: flippase-like domain-containing protein [Candidatus Helarchaeota archaeon]
MEDTGSSMSLGKKVIYLLASIVMIAIIIMYILYYIPAETVIQVITNFSWEWIVLLILSLTVCMMIRGYRIKHILKKSNKNASYKNCFLSVFGNYCINTVSPARLGDVYNAYALNRSDDINPGHSIASILISRILDISFLLIFALSTFFYHIIFGGYISPLTQGTFDFIQPTIIFIAVFFGLFFFVIIFKNQFIKIISKIIKIMPVIKKMELAEKVEDISKDCVDYIDSVIKDTKEFLKILLLSFVIILLDTLTIFYLTRAINFPPSSPRVLANPFYHTMPIHLTILASSVALLSLSFIILPGGIGQYEFAGAYVLENVAGMAFLPWAATGLLLMFVEHLIIRAVFFISGGILALYYLGKKFPKAPKETKKKIFEKPKKVSIIIPCYNEEDNIIECINRVPNFKFDYEIIVVDDGSTDKTAEVARTAKRKNVKVLRYKNNRGKGHACRIGIKYATGDVIVICDADMATQPEELGSVLAPLFNGSADFVNGSRLVYPMEEGAMKKSHIFGNHIFAWFFSLYLGVRLTDTLCGFKAFRKDQIEGKLTEDSWPDFDMLFQAKKSNLRVVEVPIHYKARKAGKSKMKTFKHGYDMLRMLFNAIG